MLWILAATAFAGQMHPEEVSLDDVLQWAPHVVVVTRSNPPSRDIAVEVLDSDGKPVEPFSVHAERLVVREVLKGDLTSGSTVEAASGYLEIYHDTHVAYYAEGMHQSPIIPTYASTVSPEAATWVAYLRPCTVAPYEGHCYAVSGARDPVEKLDSLREKLGVTPRVVRSFAEAQAAAGHLVLVQGLQGPPNPATDGGPVDTSIRFEDGALILRAFGGPRGPGDVGKPATARGVVLSDGVAVWLEATALCRGHVASCP